MDKLLLEQLAIDEVYNCPHSAADGCECRKPKPGMLQTAILKHNIDETQSWLIGDRDSDIASGLKVGLKTIFIDRKWDKEFGGDANFRCNSLLQAIQKILG